MAYVKVKPVKVYFRVVKDNGRIIFVERYYKTKNGEITSMIKAQSNGNILHYGR